MSDGRLIERTLDLMANSISIDNATSERHTPMREPQPGESDDTEPVPERRDPEPREQPQKDCRELFVGALRSF